MFRIGLIASIGIQFTLVKLFKLTGLLVGMSAASPPSVDPLYDLHLVIPFVLKCGQRRAEDRHAARLLAEQNRSAVRVQCFSAGSIGLKDLGCDCFFTGLFKQLAFGNMSV